LSLNKKKEIVKEDAVADSSSDSSDDENVKSKKGKETTINGFTVLPVSFENSNVKKYIYYKKETNKKWPSNRTLFITNLPSSCKTVSDIQKLFKNDSIIEIHFGQGQVESTTEESSSDASAHIVMKDSESLKSFLKKISTIPIEIQSPEVDGFDQMTLDYKSNLIKDYDGLQEKLDTIMMDYDKRVLETKKRNKEMAGVPDEDGFITVGPSSAKVLTAEEIQAINEKRKIKNFYAFQHRQQKKDELDTLRQKFEEDKQRIARMSANRKFKPY